MFCRMWPHQTFYFRRGILLFPAECLKVQYCLTHWGRVTHICVCKLTIIGSDDGLSPGRRQAIIWTNAGMLLIRPLGTNFHSKNAFENIVWEMASIFLDLNVLIHHEMPVCRVWKGMKEGLDVHLYQCLSSAVRMKGLRVLTIKSNLCCRFLWFII